MKEKWVTSTVLQFIVGTWRKWKYNYRHILMSYFSLKHTKTQNESWKFQSVYLSHLIYVIYSLSQTFQTWQQHLSIYSALQVGFSITFGGNALPLKIITEKTSNNSFWLDCIITQNIHVTDRCTPLGRHDAYLLD